MTGKSKRLCTFVLSQNLPTDTNKKAKSIVGIAISEGEDTFSKNAIKASASALGRKGGLIGRHAIARALTAKKRSEIAKKAAKASWHKPD